MHAHVPMPEVLSPVGGVLLASVHNRGAPLAQGCPRTPGRRAPGDDIDPSSPGARCALEASSDTNAEPSIWSPDSIGLGEAVRLSVPPKVGLHGRLSAGER